jgi:GNAT superfamily N-acetyltransferase
MEEIYRIQAYLRENARNQYESVSLPPFTLFFHPSSPVKYFNYAIPDAPTTGDHSAVLSELRRKFRERHRTPRFEFFEAFSPALPDALLTHGFIEEARQWSMICTEESLCQPLDIPGVEIITLNAESPARDVRDYILSQRQGFNPADTSEPNQNDLVQARLDFLVSGWQGFLVRIEGQPAAAAAFSRPMDGVTELAGIATREAFRRQGIASLLTWHASRFAFDLGVETVVLTAGSEASGRVYSRVGYRPFSTMLAYVEGE